MHLIDICQSVINKYQDYIKTTFYFKDPELRRLFENSLDYGRLNRGPYLEATPVFKKGKLTREIVQHLLENQADIGFLEALDGNRPLYIHQQEALCKVFKESRNIVIATGTASGKTEAFLYPIILSLYQEYRRKELGPGVRALVLYPMNALANDQRERLGELCKKLNDRKSPFSFTFGQYVGETPENKNDAKRHAEEHAHNRFFGESVFRDEMRESPPNILLTNYSMMEYLLIRPDDSPIFDNGRAKWWKFLVLDEGHQYRGAKGIEMSMLLRRLKRRLNEGGRNQPFRCIITSATIAESEQDRESVAKFASEIFGEEFDKNSIIFGEEVTNISQKEETNVTLDWDDYSDLNKKNHSHYETKSVLNRISQKKGIHIPDHLSLERQFGYLLKKDTRFTQLRFLLKNEPQNFIDVATTIFGDLPKDKRSKALSELIELLVQAEDPTTEGPLLSFRFHLFLRAIDGAFLSYIPKRHLILDRKGELDEGAVFEVALCRECGQHYLVGKIQNNKMTEAVRDPGRADFGATFFRPFDGEESDSISRENDSEVMQKYELCVRCGYIGQPRDKQNSMRCGHSVSILIEEQEEAREKQDQVPKCTVCGYRSQDPVREIVQGSDGPHAVVSTALYQVLPPGRRKILAFADGRQEAAFFAWYLENSYRDVFNRNLLLKIIKSLSERTEERLSLRDVAKGLAAAYKETDFFPESTSNLEIKNESWKTIFKEFMTEEARISLEGLGCLRWSINWPHKLKIPSVLFEQPWKMKEESAYELMFICLDLMKKDGAVELRTENEIQLDWSDLNIQISQQAIKIGLPHGQKNTRSWDGRMGKRANLLTKLLLKEGLDKEAAEEIAVRTLREIWTAFIQYDLSIYSEDKFLIPVKEKDARRINPDWWRASPVRKDDIIYQCDNCARFQPVYLNGICARYNCRGNVRPIKFKNLEPNHYRNLYEGDLPGKMRVEEHTAQIEKEKAREFQRAFKTGEINVLSSSTTFELGVDLGNLDNIFLRNIPPETFNYAQRVGRAGRRKGFPGLAITFCRRSPHDLYHYGDPQKRILRGRIRPPIVSVQNEKILMRHIAAVALSYFFRDHPHRFDSVEKIFVDLNKPALIQDFNDFMQSEKKRIEDSLINIIPFSMRIKLGLLDGSWITKIAGPISRLVSAQDEIANDYRVLKTLEEESASLSNYQKADWARRRSNTIANEDVLSFLSRKAIIPKYGFPVDVVELDPQRTTQNYDSSEVILQRDMSIAISEFAPTSRVIANKKEWTSYGIKKVAEKEWNRKFYYRCAKHNFFKSWSTSEPGSQKACCNLAFKGEYIIPEFGFLTNMQKPKVPKGRSAKIFTTRPYFLNMISQKTEEIHFNYLSLTKASPGKLVVLCEGQKSAGFYICEECGAGFREKKSQHETAYGKNCRGRLDQLCLGHEFETDVVQLRFEIANNMDLRPDVWFSFSLAYALIGGMAEILEIPPEDLNATAAYSSTEQIPPIIVYDNVPGGAGLVARLENESVLYSCLKAAISRVDGKCGCSENDSCYGCLRSYRNQYAHPHLKRGPIHQYLGELIRMWK